MTGTLEEQVLGVLELHLSSLHAKTVLRRAMQEVGVRSLESDALPGVVSAMDRGLRLFAGASGCADIRERVLGLQGARRKEFEMDVREERDVVAARLEARELCQTLGLRALLTQRVATAVSELARNICLYTPGGRVRMDLEEGSPPQLVITAEDHGAGIPHLDLVLSGRYRSRTGMGKGILGVKRLMDAFDVRTGPDGTRIVGKVTLQGAVA